MNRIKHYHLHLGCGESLQSGWAELRILHKSAEDEAMKAKRKNMARVKPGKQH
jgi:hypothetical protein